MKALLFADAHIHPHKRSTERLDDCVKALEWVFQTAIDRKIETILFLGDLFHDRQKIDVLTYQRTFEVFEKYLCKMGKEVEHFESSHYAPPFEIFLLLGNHDLFHYQKWDISSVNPLRQLPGVVVVDRPCALRIGGNSDGHLVGFLPYTHDPIEDLKTVEKDWKEHSNSTDKKRKRVLCGHCAVDGAVWNIRAGTMSEVNIEHDGDMIRVGPEVFDEWNRTFLGHYHAEQKLNKKVEYIGSPLELSFGEAFQKKHILIYDFDTQESEYVNNNFSPKHLIVKQDELDHYKLEGNFVRVEVDDITSKDVVDLRRELVEKVGTLEIKQAAKNEEHVVLEAKAILYKEDEMLEKYLNQVEIPEVGEGDKKKPLDKNVLLEIGKQICQGAGNE